MDPTIIDNRIEVLILQHPQEKDAVLGTAALAVQSFRRASLKIGLSWPNLSKVLGRTVDPKRWAVLYLGSVKPAAIAAGRELVAVDRKGAALDDQPKALADIAGAIVLDGSWSEAKALWWRNPWLLKCRRVVLAPRRPSRYGRLRREPRRDSLSTLEAVALLISRLESRPEIETALAARFDELLAHHRGLPNSSDAATVP